MGDVISSHLDEAKRDMISARTGTLMGEFGRLYEQQYAVALFNKIRFDIEGGGGPQPQLLHRKIPLENKSIFSGSLFQYLEENKKWRNRFAFVADSYIISYYDSKAAHDKHLHPKGTINCAGYKVLTSVEQYLDVISDSLPGMKAKVGSSPFLKCPSQFALILWHPYGRHYYFCVTTEKEQQKWHAVLQDCVRHSNDGLCEEEKVQTPAFTDSVRLYRQAQGHYGTWEMMCGVPSQILSNLVMEDLLPELRELISPRLKGKLHDRQRNWMLISDAVYSLVQAQCRSRYEAVLAKCEAARSSLEASIRKDMDQIITSKEHITNQIRATLLPKAEKLLKVSIQPYISSILDALMEPTSRGFFEVRDLFFRELVDMSKNALNDESKETVAQHMEKISMLAFHPVKMQSCYEKVDQLSLEGLQQRFDVSSPSVFVQRAQILMRKQMDDAVYTFEQILHQTLASQGSEDVCKSIQRCQDRVIKKFDYDSSTVRKRFFREALLQIFIPYMLKQLSPSCNSELPRFQELIFEDFSSFILVNNVFEEVVLHSVMKDIMSAVKEAAVQRRHNLYRDSIVLSSSDPSLHLLGENPSIDWAGEYGGAPEESEESGGDAGGDGEAQRKRRTKQVVSMIQEEGSSVMPGEACMEVSSDDPIVAEVDSHDDPSDQEGSAPPKELENPADMLNGDDLKETQPEEQREEVASAAGGAPVEGEPSSNREESSPTSLPTNILPSEAPGRSPGKPQETPPGASPDGASPDGASPDGTSPDGTSPDGASPETPAGASPDGASPDGASPDGASPDGASPDGASPETPPGASPDGASPDGASPDGAPPDGTSPDGASPDGTSPDGTSPDGASPETPAGASPDGASPDGASPDGASPDGASPDGASPETPPGASPDGASPDGASPDGASPDGASPDGASPDGASPDGASPDGASPDGASPDGASPDGASPDGASPETPPGASPDGASPDGASLDGASPETPPDMLNGSMLKEEAAGPEEQREEDVSPKVEPLAGEGPVIQVEMVQGEPSSNQEEAFPAPPFPEELLPEATEMTLETPPEGPPHDDSGFHSPTNEVMEEVTSSTCLSPPSVECPVEEGGGVGGPDPEPRTGPNQ